MRTSLLLTIAVGICVTSVPAQDKGAKSDLEKLEGTWAVASYEDADEKAPDKDLKGWTYTFKGSKITVTKKGKAQPEDTFKLNEAKKPKEIDIMIDNQKATGIYDLQADRQRACAGILKSIFHPQSRGEEMGHDWASGSDGILGRFQ